LSGTATERGAKRTRRDAKRTRRQGEAGFSLVEVVCSIGLLGGVLISVAGLMVAGDRLVSSGRHSSEVLAVAQGIMEEMDEWSFRQSYSLFDSCNAGETSCTVDTRTETLATG